jgi:hypothetical protein
MAEFTNEELKQKMQEVWTKIEEAKLKANIK